MQIEKDVMLAPHTTFHIGGPARYFARVKTVGELQEVLAFAKKENLKIFILGGGSNVLVPDEGFDGLVIKIELRGLEIQEDISDTNKKVIMVGAGESWDALVERTVKENLWGVENLSGIPGTVGGAVVQNIGAYGAALSQTLSWVEVLDGTGGEIKKMSNEQCVFGYRDSFFKHDDGRHVVLRAAFGLTTVANPNFSYHDPNRAYRDIARALAEHPEPSLADIRAAVLAIRADKFPNLAVEGSAGSFFLNPIMSNEQAQTLRERFPDLPLFPMPETTDMKVPLGWILDHVFHLRGYAMGKARLFEGQALVVVAQRGASTHEVKALVRTIKEKVKKDLHIEIKEEVRIL